MFKGRARSLSKYQLIRSYLSKKIPVKGLAGDAAALCDLADSDRIDRSCLHAFLHGCGETVFCFSPSWKARWIRSLKAPFSDIAAGSYILFSKFYHIFPNEESLLRRLGPSSDLIGKRSKTPYYPRSSHADDTEFVLRLNEL